MTQVLIGVKQVQKVLCLLTCNICIDTRIDTVSFFTPDNRASTFPWIPSQTFDCSSIQQFTGQSQEPFLLGIPINQNVYIRHVWQPWQCFTSTEAFPCLPLWVGRITIQERGVRLVILHILPETFTFWNRKYPPEHQLVSFPCEGFLIEVNLFPWLHTES